MKPLVGEKVWFGPRGDSLGWGWAPVSWEGWLVAAVAVGVAAVSFVAVGDPDRAVIPGGVAILALLVLSFLKGTSPGGWRRRAEFDQLRDEQEREKVRRKFST